MTVKMIRDDDMKLDQDVRRILAHASVAAVPDGAEARLLARIAAEIRPNIVEFHRVPPRRRLFPMIAALPLAASLVLGVYLGAAGSLDWLMPAAITGDVADGGDVLDELGGVGEADAFVEQDQT